jgi:hypothetical protein
MKRLLFIVPAAMVLFNCLNSPESKDEPEKIENDLYRLALNGSVKSIVTDVCDLLENFGELEEANCLKENDISFNIAGNVLEDRYYNIDGGLVTEYSYTYNNKELITEEIIRDYSYNYYARYVYKYDNNSNLIQISEYDQEGVYYGRESYTYDDNGNRIESILYDTTDQIVAKETYGYDDQDNMIVRNTYDSAESLQWKYRFEYDPNGNVVKESAYDTTNEIVQVIEYAYNTAGKQTVMKVTDVDGMMLYLRSSDYNENQDLVEGTEYDASGEIVFTFKGTGYSYDHFDNWNQRDIEIINIYYSPLPIRWREKRDITYR